MVLKHYSCENTQNLKSSNNSTPEQQLVNNRYINTHNATCNVFLNNNSGNREWDCSYNTRSLNSNTTTPLLIYRQNIRGLRNKIDEIFILWSSYFPHVLCFTEHHLRNDEINCTYINSYNLGSKYCRVNRKYGGVSIFVHETLSFTTIDLSEFCNDQYIEICAVKSHFSSSNFSVLSVYRSPSGNFIDFLSSLDTILNQLYNSSLNIIICGDFNINCLENSNNMLQLDSLLASYNLQSVVDFPTRITNSSCTAIYNIFINKHINIDFSIKSCPDGLSDHDAQILTLNDIKIQKPSAQHLTRRIINDSTISEFQLNLSYESWVNIFNGDDVDTIFNNFLNTYLRIFYHTFPLKKCQNNYNNKPWKTPGIIIPSQHKTDLYLLCRSTKDSKLNNYYKKIL